MQPSDGEVTGVLAALPHGNADAEARLMELTYRELRRIANAYLRREREAVSVQASDSAPGLPPVAPLPPEHDVLQADRFLTFQARSSSTFAESRLLSKLFPSTILGKNVFLTIRGVN